ncbi:MAG: hypothetical protein KF824_10560 [Fimbriimonadaceae bacterium]|nr:MAG: hypothetical protein KF824_10560 [Fimbriimonadaceae bacterium]
MVKRILILGSVMGGAAFAASAAEPVLLRLNLKPGDVYVHSGKTTITTLDQNGHESSATRHINSSMRVKSRQGDAYVMEFQESSTYADESVPGAYVEVNVNSPSKTIRGFDILNQKANDASMSSFFAFELPKKKVKVGDRWSQMVRTNNEVARVDYEIVERAKVKGYDAFIVNFYSDPAQTPNQVFSGNICYDIKTGMVVRVNMKGQLKSMHGAMTKIAGNMELTKVKRGR